MVFFFLFLWSHMFLFEYRIVKVALLLKVWLPEDSIPAYTLVFYRKMLFCLQMARWAPSIDFQVTVASETLIPLPFCNGWNKHWWCHLFSLVIQQPPVFCSRCFILRKEEKKHRVVFLVLHFSMKSLSFSVPLVLTWVRKAKCKKQTAIFTLGFSVVMCWVVCFSCWRWCSRELF